MASNRRKFLRNITLGTGAIATGLPVLGKDLSVEKDQLLSGAGKSGFNMCGYAAPKIDKVRIGIIGLGNRGSGAVGRLSFIENAEIGYFHRFRVLRNRFFTERANYAP